MQTRPTAALGKEGEERVVAYLEAHGFAILERNYRKLYGEIDIIAMQGQLVVFIEVKTRRVVHFDFSCVITRSKQRKIALVARDYITRKNIYDKKVFRFDVALLSGDNDQLAITYIPHAFAIESW